MTNDERYLKEIASELKSIRKVLERMTQAPIFYKEDQLFTFADRYNERAIEELFKSSQE